MDRDHPAHRLPLPTLVRRAAPSGATLGIGSRVHWIAAFSAVFLAAIAAYAALRPAEIATPVVVSMNSAIAVLPFDDMTGNAELAYFGAGVAEDIISMLARIPVLTVAAGASGGCSPSRRGARRGLSVGRQRAQACQPGQRIGLQALVPGTLDHWGGRRSRPA